ncbi:7-cyano-7-deazaguanine synthase [Noviherbaspirillum saxi]|uniref:7-cyano-7-deazaguanine synthase n=1 Tax=Noviherbaspirillum saxi TaxID=2320863 RepID=A0A3A3FSI0_9BURK|nr:7-cyano-7-deazaguanine synthase [Noviherbaspirillum saxi]RJF97151.1 7-cyano-7-deazaguanine synthase [Noviherbaspirillum saxi]
MTKAILLSGGMDSISLAYWQRPTVAICIDYGQKPAEAEIRASSAIASLLNIRHEVIRIDCSSLGSGDLSGTNALQLAPSSEWWPFRNQMLITLAVMKGASLNISELMLGTVKSDGHHADGTEAFISAADTLVALQEGGIRITAPAIQMSTAALVQASGIPREVLAYAHSCHTANYACGTCRGCIKHRNTYRELGDEEPY